MQEFSLDGEHVGHGECDQRGALHVVEDDGEKALVGRQRVRHRVGGRAELGLRVERHLARLVQHHSGAL